MDPLTSWITIPYQDFLVVHGYIRSLISNRLTLLIPQDIINYIVIFYYDVSTWKLTDESLNKFLHILPNGSAMYSNSFYVEGIEFCCSLCPNGWKHNQTGFVQYYLELKSLPSNINNCTVYFELYCYDTKSSWKGIRILSKKQNAVGWFHYTLPLRDCRQIILNQLETRQKSLIFGCSVKILHVNYKQHVHRTVTAPDHDHHGKTDKIYQDTNEHKSDINEDIILIKQLINNYIGFHCAEKRQIISLNDHIQITWILNKYPLSRFKRSLHPKNFHSPSFENDYWCFECQANFKHNIMIYCRLKLLRMPENIKNIKIKCLLETNMKCLLESGTRVDCDKKEYEYMALNYDHNYSTWKTYETDLKHENSIRISCFIEIIEIWNNLNQIVDKSLWNKYGIICNNNYKPNMIIQYADDIENNGKNQKLLCLKYQNKTMKISKSYIKPNFLNIPISI